jgi:hypothetical protein
VPSDLRLWGAGRVIYDAAMPAIDDKILERLAVASGRGGDRPAAAVERPSRGGARRALFSLPVVFALAQALTVVASLAFGAGRREAGGESLPAGDGDAGAPPSGAVVR